MWRHRPGVARLQLTPQLPSVPRSHPPACPDPASVSPSARPRTRCAPIGRIAARDFEATPRSLSEPRDCCPGAAGIGARLLARGGVELSLWLQKRTERGLEGGTEARGRGGRLASPEVASLRVQRLRLRGQVALCSPSLVIQFFCSPVWQNCPREGIRTTQVSPDFLSTLISNGEHLDLSRAAQQ